MLSQDAMDAVKTRHGITMLTHDPDHFVASARGFQVSTTGEGGAIAALLERLYGLRVEGIATGDGVGGFVAILSANDMARGHTKPTYLEALVDLAADGAFAGTGTAPGS